MENAEKLKERIRENDEADKKERWLLVVFEWLYFFMHLANRIAYKELGDGGRVELQEILVTLTVRPAIEGLMGHWPEHLKAGMVREFIEKMNDAELEYAKCKTWIEEGRPFSETSLFGKLTLNVARLMGPPWDDDVATLAYIRDIATNACVRMDMVRLIRLVK